MKLLFAFLLILHSCGEIREWHCAPPPADGGVCGDDGGQQ